MHAQWSGSEIVHQTEQLAIVKAMEVLENTNIRNSRRRTVTIYTDSKVTIQSIKKTTETTKA